MKSEEVLSELKNIINSDIKQAKFRLEVTEERKDNNIENQKAISFNKATIIALNTVLYDIKILEATDTPLVYVEYLDSKNNFCQAKKDFTTYEKAWQWIKKTFDTPSKDFIKYY